MAVNGNGYVNFVDQATTKVKGQFVKPAELLAQRNDWMKYARWQESNLDTCEEFVIRTSLPDAYFVTVGKGVPISKSTSAKIQEGWAIIEQSTEIPRHLVRGEALAETLMNERMASFESVAQKAAQAVIYANGSLNDDQFNGWAVRMATLTGGNAKQIFNCGGATANAQTSIYAVKYMERGAYFITPPGMTAGLSSEDMGLCRATDASGVLDVYRQVVNMGLGFALPDFRCLGRICNIDVAQLAALSGNQAPTSFLNIIHGMLYLISRMGRLGSGPIVFHAGQAAFSALVRLATEKSVNGLGYIEASGAQFGVPGSQQLQFHGNPIVLMDQILETEAVVS